MFRKLYGAVGPAVAQVEGREIVKCALVIKDSVRVKAASFAGMCLLEEQFLRCAERWLGPLAILAVLCVLGVKDGACGMVTAIVML